MTLFVSTFVNKIDRKGRVSVPSSFRAALAQQNGFVAFPSFTATAIECHPTSFLENLAAAAERNFKMFSTAQDDINQLIFSSSHQMSFDPEGRITLSADLLSHAGISDQAAFVGMGRTFQIWEPARLDIHRAEALARARANPPQFTVSVEAES